MQTISFDDAVALVGGYADIVKIDCEGGEYELVNASSDDSWSGVQRVVMEFHPVGGHSWAELEQRFAVLGLQVQRISTLNGYGCVWLSREPGPLLSS